MHTSDTEQGHSYHEFIQNFSSLFKEIKEKDGSIHNAVAGFNIVKFLIEHGTSWGGDKDEICEVILRECNMVKEARQELQEKARERLNTYIGDGVGNSIKAVLIRDNHASITLEDNKKKFKISEFLNSDFCQNNGISGFSTLHSDGKSGMHGFVHNKIRHYVVTDGSYEMTLNWYANGEKCTIKIKIDKDGVDLVEHNGVTDDQLKANKDVKIGGLFLHEIKFREKGKANEVQKSFETFIGSDDKNVGVQTADKTREKEDHYSQFGPQSNSRKQSYDSGIEEDFNNETHSDENRNPFLNSRNPFLAEVEDKLSGEYGKNSKGRDSEAHTVSSTLVDKESQSTQSTNLADQAMDELKEVLKKEDKGLKEPVQQVIKKNIPKDSFSENVLPEIKEEKPIYKWLKNKIEGKEDNQNLDAPEEKLSSKSNQGNIVEKSDSGRPLSPISTNENIDVERSSDTLLTEFTSKLDKETQKFPLKLVDQKGMSEQTRERLLKDGLLKDSSTDIKTNDSSHSSSTHTDHYNSQVNPEHLTQKPEEEKLDRQKENEVPEEHGQNSEYHNNEAHTVLSEPTSKESKSTNLADQAMDELREVLKKPDKGLRKPEQQITEEHIPKDSFSENVLQEIKEDKPIYKWLKDKIEGKEDNQNLDVLKKTLSQKNGQDDIVEENDSNRPTSPVGVGGNTNVEQSKDTLLTEFTSKLDKETKKFPLKPVDQKEMSGQTRERLLIDGLLKRDPYELLEKDEAQLKVGVIEEEREDTLVEHTDSSDRNRIKLGRWLKKVSEDAQKSWANKHAAKQQQENEDKSISI